MDLREVKKRKREEFRQRLYKLMLDMLGFCDTLGKDFSSRKITEQLVRSGTSIGANYFEATSASSRKDYLNYFQISLKSANETKFWLSLLKDSSKSDMAKTERLIDELEVIANILASSILTTKGKKCL